MLPVLAQNFFKIAGNIFPFVFYDKYFNVRSSNSKLFRQNIMNQDQVIGNIEFSKVGLKIIDSLVHFYLV